MSQQRLRPPLAFRVGVTGHRGVAEDDPRLVSAAESVLDFVRETLARLAAAEPARRAYAAAPFSLRVVSPLAAGADRIVARAGLKLGAELYAPLPFKQSDYVKDFPDRADAFDELVKHARALELDGARIGGATQGESYAAVGRHSVRNCDLLIAIWDGEPAHGPGGTADIVDYATRYGLRVWWIHANHDVAPKLLRHHGDFHARERAPAGEAAYAGLADYLAVEILPPEAEPPERDGPLGRLAGLYRQWRVPDRSPLEEFYAETPRPRRAIWRAYALFMRLVAPAKAAAPPPPEAGAGRWEALYQAANRLSIDYGDRYRSSYIWVALMVIVALTTLPIGAEPKLGWQKVCVVGEVFALVAISFLVVHNYAWRWHERWIAYRLLAELARKQRVLSLIGRSLPSADVAQLTAAAKWRHGTDGGDKPWRDVWIAWMFRAYRRACDPPTGAMTDCNREAFEAGRSLIEEQMAYHQARRDRSERAGARVRDVAELFFLLSILAAFAKLALVLCGDGQAIPTIVLITSLASSIATASVGIRAYAEFELLVRQSTHMIHALELKRRELEGLRLDAPLASLHLGRALFMTATEMMRDITGWAHLFQVKALETG
jgi:hypothetical protein